MTTKKSNNKKTEPMAYDTLLSIVLLEKEWYNNKVKKAKIKAERKDWYEMGLKCTCDRKLDYNGEYADGGDEYSGTCPFCKKRNKFYKRLQKLANKQRSIRKTIQSRIKHY